jgi:hypothetical protein
MFRRKLLPLISRYSEGGGCLNVQTVDSSGTKVRFCQTSRLYTPEDSYYKFFVDFSTTSSK